MLQVVDNAVGGGGGGGKGGGGCRARFTGIRIGNSRFTEIKTGFSRITHHSASALIFHPNSTTGLTCCPFCMIIACTLNNCFLAQILNLH